MQKKSSIASKSVKKRPTHKGYVRKPKYMKRYFKIKRLKVVRLTKKAKVLPKGLTRFQGGGIAPIRFTGAKPKVPMKRKSSLPVKKKVAVANAVPKKKSVVSKKRVYSPVKTVKKNANMIWQDDRGVQLQHCWYSIDGIIHQTPLEKSTFKDVLEKIVLYIIKNAVMKTAEFDKFKNSSKKLMAAISNFLHANNLPPHLINQAANSLNDYFSKRDE